MGAERRPICLPARQGPAALIWKNAVRGMRSFTLDQALPWLVILGLSLAIFLAPDLGTMAWLVLVWIFFVGGRAVQSLRRDLKIWWLLRQFPYSSEQLVLLNLGLPLLGIALTSLVVLIFAVWIGVSVPPVIAWMFFPGAVGVAFAAAVDILRQVSHQPSSIRQRSGQILTIGPVGRAGIRYIRICRLVDANSLINPALARNSSDACCLRWL